MKKIMQNIGMRILSCLLCTICVLVLGVAAVGSVFYAEMQTSTTAYKEGAQKIADSYALYTLNHVVDGENLEELEEFLSSHNVSCEITLVEAEDDNIKSNVIYTNGSENVEWKYQTEVVKGTSYTYLLSSLWSALGNSNYDEPDSPWKEFNIENYVYDVNSGIFYYETAIGYFPIQDIYIIYNDDTPSCDYSLNILDGKQYYFNEYYDTALDISQYKKWSAVSLDGLQLDMESGKEIQLITDTKMVEKNLCRNVYTYDENIMGNTISCDYDGPVDTYVIQIGWEEGQMFHSYFSEWQKVCTFIYSFQDSLAAIVIVFFLLFLLSFVAMIFSAIEDKEKLGFLHRVPVGIYSAIILLAEYALFLLIRLGISTWIYYSAIQLDVAYSVLVIVIFLMVLIAFIYLQNIITRIRTRSFLRYSELYYAGKMLKVVWKALVSITITPLQKLKRTLQENTSLMLKGLGILLAIPVLEFILFAYSGLNEEFMMFCIVVEKCIEIPVVLAVLLQMKKLQEGTKRIAAGDLSTPIDTSKMYWEFKNHGENINNVSQSIRLAVEEQMKSERFKTELITNVSHDIKTPLTSIINYVDLIKKEDITDEKLCEYVEVLDRQSARLKKLIEDLMEASKASTGNLAVHMEECDVEVLLTQVIGEFEERLQNNQLEVVVAKPEHPVKIQADGRHMWRVLDNLLGNACKYAMPNTRVYVSLEQQGKEAVIVFKNISKAALNIPSEELMERFVRGDSSRNTEGSGLGLSIAQSLTELIHGTMKLDIDGDLFKVTLRFPI